MEMSGEYRIPAPREKVWAALNDPAVLRETIPGCESIEKVSDTEMKARVTAKVGPVKATFNGDVKLTNLDPPNGYTISGEGKGGVAGFAKGGADVSLEEDGDGTILRYTAKGQVGGKLAQIGARLVDATAKQMADAFFGAFAAKLSAADEIGQTAQREDVVSDPVVVAEAIEERAEVAAGNGFLGGPYVWGLLALIVVIGAIMLMT
ncbi:MAG TPA: carbon monoxide dehydrogenase subunit G [Bauldia sp.]|nr:carbon monoxide dehydrogenase subunit G [Bauldia sp.]